MGQFGGQLLGRGLTYPLNREVHEHRAFFIFENDSYVVQP
jgi:hypothetical protein